MDVKLKDLLRNVDEMKQEIAVKKALVGFLKTRYLSRDGMPPQSSIAYERSTVTEDVILDQTINMERDIERLEKKLEATLEEHVNG